MAIKSKEDLILAYKSLMQETPTDAELGILEDLSDTLNDLSTKANATASDSEDWKAKYEKCDAEWRKRYADRFVGKTSEDVPEVKEEREKERGQDITINDLFTVKE